MPLPPEIDGLFNDCTPQAYAVYQYCSSVIAHRLIKMGWENYINYLPPRRLILLAMYLPQHCRKVIVVEAYNKAKAIGDMPVITLVETQFQMNKQRKAAEAAEQANQ